MKFLHFAFIGAFPGRYHQNSLNVASNHVSAAPLSNDALKINVGGVKYSLFSDDIRKHSGSFFEKLLSKSHNDEPIPIYRDGTLFKFVNSFLVTGQLPRDATGRVELDDNVLEALKNEASYFGLKDLMAECDLQKRSLVASSPAAHLPLTISADDASLVRNLRRVWRPLKLIGTLSEYTYSDTFLKDTRGDRVDVDQLTSLAKRISRAHSGQHDNRLEIDSCMLRGTTLENIEYEVNVTPLFPNLAVEIRARKLVIRTPGEVLDSVIDTTDEKDCLGFVEVLLNSTYTGGELQVSQNGHTTELKTRLGAWVAVPATTNSSIRPVTSGTRVSLVCGMYGVTASSDPKFSFGRTEKEDWYSLLEPCRGYDDSLELECFIRSAKYLSPDQSTANIKKFEIDAIFLKERYLSRIVRDEREMNGNIRSMFPYKKLDFRPTKAQLRTADPCGQNDSEVTSSACDKKEGYLGTLVVVNRDEMYNHTGGVVTVTATNGTSMTLDTVQNWYAVAAGGSSTITPISVGSRMSMHYDIYDVTPVHDPLSLFHDKKNDATDDSDSDSDDDSDDPDVLLASLHEALVTRATTSERVKSEVLAAVEAELTTSDALVITLQHMYPEHQHNNNPSYLNGGDRALYEILASQYDVQPVTMTLQSACDTATGRNKIISGTYSTVNTGSEASNTKLIVPVTLNNVHQNVYKRDTYTATGLCVTKKLKKM